MLDTFKRIFVGRPLATSEQEHQRINKTVALAVFSSDAISSTAYATQEILFVIAVVPSSLALGLPKLVPIAVAVALLLAIVATSYRQTIFAYPSGGGSYIVSRENLGEMPSLIAGASLLVDYILTVAVSISAGVAAIVSIPQFQGGFDYTVEICIAILILIMVVNLRGVKESGRVFAFPTYLYIVMVSALVFLGLTKTLFGWFGGVSPVPYNPQQAAEGVRLVGGNLDTLPPAQGLLVRRGRADGCRSDFERRSRLPATGVEERGDHARLDGDDPRNIVSRRFDPRASLAPLPE